MNFFTQLRDNGRSLDQESQERIARATLYGSLETAASDILALLLLAFSACVLSGLPFPLAENNTQRNIIVMVLLSLAVLRFVMSVPTLIGIGITTATISRLTRMRT